MSSENATRPVCIAVLPFENISDHREDDYFSRGFVEDLITDLAHFRSLQVISSYTSRKVGAEARQVIDAARELDIDYLLEGNLRRVSGHVRLSAQLMDAAGGRVVWANRFDMPMDAIFEIQDQIVAQVVGAISTRIDKVLLAAARKKPLTSLAAYDCWLRGMDHMRRGTPEADLEARRIFKQALGIDPKYSRAYAGLSLSHFNDWSCQLWEKWEETERKAYAYALEASRLDDTDHIVQMILGRILLFRRQFDRAEAHVDKSLALNANDADCLVQLAFNKTYLGKAAEGEQLFLKAMRLNPYRNVWYYPYGAITLFCQRRYDPFIEMALKAPLTDVWVDLPAFLAAAYLNTGRPREAAAYLNIFVDNFAKKIMAGRPPQPDEIVAWLKLANPFKYEEDTRHFIQGVMAAGLDDLGHTRPPVGGQAIPAGTAGAVSNRFVRQDGMWRMTFEGHTVQMPEVKGFIDIARLLAVPDIEVHCTELMGSPDSLSEPDPMLDEKARRAYETRIRDLRTEIGVAETMNDLGRAEKLNAELDQLTDHLSKSLGLGRRTRSLDADSDRARAAVTWRIRNAIRKIESVHPSLANHFSHAIRTGAFCSYNPEKDTLWNL
jgi:TolB-like protein/tetratricopeptide (TPR) repeat protein